MDVSDVLRDRMHEPGGLQRMAIVSAAAHGAILAFVLFAPHGWFSGGNDAPKTVMTISLGGGAPGPSNGGFTQQGGKAIQEATLDAKPEPQHAPAAKTQEMTLPAAKPVKAMPKPVVKEAPDQAKGTRTSKGEPTPGSANVETGARGVGFGLSTGGGNGSGSSLDVDMGTFCCPEWLSQALDMIRKNWKDQSEVHDHVMVHFFFQRDGSITDLNVTKRSNSVQNTTEAQRALLATKRVLPLPPQYPNPNLGMNLDFEYR